ncbi:MAG: MFS transporter [Candidatus Woesearchaeota archaeon]
MQDYQENDLQNFESEFYKPNAAELENGGGEGKNDKSKLEESLQSRKVEAPDEKPLSDKNKEYAIKEGCATAIMTGFGENNVNAFAVKIGATDSQIGLLNSLPLLVSAFVQLFSVTAIDKFGNRKRVLLPADMMQALTWLFMAGVAFYLRSPILLIILFTASITLKMFMMPIWSSLLSEIVDENERGRYFGLRNRITGALNFAAILVAGFTINFFARQKDPQFLYYGFGIVFTIAFISKIVSWHYMRKMTEKPILIDQQSRFSFFEFVKKMPTNNFGRFILFISIYDIAVYMGAPFFTAYMLKELGMNLWVYTLVNGASTIFGFLVMTYWGKYTDIFGNKKIIIITSFLIPLVPLLFILWGNPYYLFAVNAFSGFVWAGYNLSCSNFMFDSVTPKKRVRAIAYYNIIDGVTMFLGATLGAFLLTRFPSGVSIGALSLSKYKMVLLLSALARFSIALAYAGRIKEVRLGTPQVGEDELFLKLIAVEPLKETTYLIQRGLEKGVNGVKKLGSEFLEITELKNLLERKEKTKKAKGEERFRNVNEILEEEGSRVAKK